MWFGCGVGRFSLPRVCPASVARAAPKSQRARQSGQPHCIIIRAPRSYDKPCRVCVSLGMLGASPRSCAAHACTTARQESPPRRTNVHPNRRPSWCAADPTWCPRRRARRAHVADKSPLGRAIGAHTSRLIRVAAYGEGSENLCRGP